MTTIALLILVGGLGLFLLSLSLIYRKIPRNALYGIRIPASMESDERWYEINAYGGRQLAIWSWAIVAAGVAGLLIPAEHLQAYAWTSAAVTLAAVLIPTVRIVLWSRTL